MFKFFVTVALILAIGGVTYAAESALPVEHWLKIGEERQILNEEFGSGLTKRYFVDPAQHNSIASTLSVFYKDGTEKLFWKGWNLHTDKAKYALMLNELFYVGPKGGPMTSNMVTLSALVDAFLRSGANVKKMLWFDLCFMNEAHDILTTDDGERVCYKVNFTKQD